MFAGAPPPKFPGNKPTKDESTISKWNKDMIDYSKYLMDLCVPWMEDSSPLFERSTNGFCSLINEWNKQSATFIERQHFCVLSNFITRYGARVGGSKSNAVNLILRLFFIPYFTYNKLVTSRVHPLQHKQQTNTTTMVMEPLAPPAAWIQ